MIGMIEMKMGFLALNIFSCILDRSGVNAMILKIFWLKNWRETELKLKHNIVLKKNAIFRQLLDAEY
jgi:hypothetical protein